MPTINLGGELAAVVQFIVIMGLLQPVVILVTPASFQAAYYGTNGIVSATQSNYNSQIAMPIATTATTANGFGAVTQSNLIIGGLGGLAFIYAGFTAFMTSILNFPNMLYIIFVGSFSYLPFAGIAIVTLVSIGILSYISIINIMIGISLIQKGSVQEGG